MPDDDWSDEETDDPPYADERNFYKVEKWTFDRSKVDSLLYAGNTSPRLGRYSIAISRNVRAHG
jgi:hypothetical protein